MVNQYNPDDQDDHDVISKRWSSIIIHIAAFLALVLSTYFIVIRNNNHEDDDKIYSQDELDLIKSSKIMIYVAWAFELVSNLFYYSSHLSKNLKNQIGVYTWLFL